MAAYFLDSSAIVKRYVSEIGTAWVLTLADPQAANDLYVVAVSGVEVVSAIARRSKGGGITAAAASTALAQFHHDFAHQYQVLEVSDAVVDRAMALARAHSLRAYDAIQLAAAVELNSPRASLTLAAIAVISADQELNAAAMAEGLHVDDPNSHP